LAQAYCFVGPDQVGKRTLARYLAVQLLKVNEKQLDTHPDFYYLNREENEKTGRLKKDISISQARLLKERVSNKSWLGGYRVIIIDEAELLNKESANALLKVLEDSKEKIVFFLLTTDDQALLSTVRSRCQIFYLFLLSEQKMITALTQAGFESQMVKEVVPLAWGRPGKAITLLSDDAERQENLQENKRWQEMVELPFYQRLKKTDDLLKDKENADKEKFSKIIPIWQMIWREVLKDKINKETQNNSPLSEKSSMNAVEVMKFIDLLSSTRNMLRQNINPKLLLEEVMLETR
jgi:DNA polymerase-3 subunit delta'